MTTQKISQEKAEALAGRMLGMVNEVSVALMTSVGHRTGLFDAMAGLAPSTSAEIASAAGRNERYVREWLGAMVTGGSVEYDPENGTYSLPAEHAAWLTRAATPDNLAVTAQWIPLLGSVENKIVEAFERGGGVPYSAYPRFHELMAEESAQTVVTALNGSILPWWTGSSGAWSPASTCWTSVPAAAGPSTTWRPPTRTAASPATISRRKASPAPVPRPRDGA
jgi:hypothetical protein